MLIPGGLFDSSDPTFERAFSFSLKAVQKNSKFSLSRSHFSHAPTNGKAAFKEDDSFAASKKGKGIPVRHY